MPEEFEQTLLELVACMCGNQYVHSNVLSKLQLMLLTLGVAKINLLANFNTDECHLSKNLCFWFLLGKKAGTGLKYLCG